MNEISRYAKILIKAEEYLQETREYTEEDTFLNPQQQNLGFEIELHTDIIKEREEKINKITHTIFTVNSMLKDLSEMVCEQGYMIDTVEANIEESVIKSKQATAELLKSEKEGKSSKQRHCLVVLLVALLLFVITMIATNYYKHIEVNDK